MTNLIESEENEIKIVPTEVTQAKLLGSLHGKKADEIDSVLRTIKAVLSLAEFDISQESVENIVDEYFDTEDLALFGFHASLRIRRSGTQVEMTIKKPKEQERGQFTRSEFSKNISEKEYSDLLEDGFRKAIESILPDTMGKRLSKVLQVINERRNFMLLRGNEQYKLSLDLIKFVNPKLNKTSESESEVEIEALNEAAKQKLGTIRRNLVEIMRTFDFSKDSKYERGIARMSLKGNKSWRVKMWFSNINTDSGRNWIEITIAIIGIIVTIILAIIFSK